MSVPVHLEPVGTAPDSGWWVQTCLQLAAVLPQLRIAVYASGGSGYHHAALIAQWAAIPEPLDAARICAGELDQYDVLVMPGGGLRAMGGLLQPLGETGAAQIQRWVEEGGLYVGSCAGAFLGARLSENFLTSHPEARGLHLLNLKIANAADGGLGGLDSPGVGVVQAELTDPAHPLARGLPQQFPIVHYNGPCFLPPAGSGISGAVTWKVATAQFTPWETSLPGSSGPEGAEEHSSTPQVAARLAVAAGQLAVSGPCGQGTVVLFGSHPEFGFSVLQLGWGVAARLLANALALGVSRSSGPLPSTVLPQAIGRDSVLKSAGLLAQAAERFSSLVGRPPDLRAAPAFMGLDAQEVWKLGLTEAATVAQATAAYLTDLAQQPDFRAVARWTDHEPVAAQDYGLVGLAQLARHITALLDRAELRLQAPVPAQTFPYDAWEDHPYHLLVSSYLSAAGLTASASLAAGILGRLNGVQVAPHPLVSVASASQFLPQRSAL
ncbi:BPL-N domain-containing protein [Deinococcus sp. QL22]|uniref:BPL-N domain-containing protein n=1 Tax=Deinococcus sp. QL22 TaxID=2939437 RepID=UPI002017CF6C|nr:BPL-N domain-containing protein [Deinococcus sp. QL22]UQN09131.1 BPL-N domain-containing protein [Deinococcus sp. QL22]